MYNPITLTEIAIWIGFALIEHAVYRASASNDRMTIVTEIFKLAGFEMTATAEVAGGIACLVLRLFFGSNALLAAIVILTVQLAVSTRILKYFISLD